MNSDGPATASTPAVCLLSGGLDSATALYWAIDNGYAPVALSFDYGQRHRAELTAASRVALAAGVATHHVIELGRWRGSALNDDIAVPKGRKIEDMADGIPVTYVPARNTIFLAYALAVAELESAAAIVIGVNALDYSGYPDCRPEYISAFQGVANVATKQAVDDQPVSIVAPLIDLTKAQIIRLGTTLGVPYGVTHSCYDPIKVGDDWLACGECDSCLIRRHGFADARVDDPTRYAEEIAW